MLNWLNNLDARLNTDTRCYINKPSMIIRADVVGGANVVAEGDLVGLSGHVRAVIR